MSHDTTISDDRLAAIRERVSEAIVLAREVESRAARMALENYWADGTAMLAEIDRLKRA